MSECSICQSDIKDKIKMSCGSQHEYCFECILKNIEVTGELRTCPLCNGGDKFIIFDVNQQYHSTDNYYSIYLFTKSLPVIKKILKDKSQNTCIVSEKILQFYIKNKIQLEFVQTLNKDYELDEIVKYIKFHFIYVDEIIDTIIGDYIYGGSAGNNPSSSLSQGSGRGNAVYNTRYSSNLYGLFGT
jgi:hypothetical protein